MSIVYGTLKSKLVGEELSYRAILPNGYIDSSRKYPVLYLLHGLFGSCENWIELTRLAELAGRRNLIVITPEGKDAWYVDSATTASDRFESYIVEELMPETEREFKIDGRREMRAIVGNSMGGYGAIKFGLKYPCQFAFAGSFSGAFDAPKVSDKNPGTFWEGFEGSIMAAFGPRESTVRQDNDLFGIIDKMPARAIEKLPRLYMDCGARDHFIKVNRELSEAMTKRQIAHEFQELPGGHDWEYWDSRVPHFIEKLGQLPGWEKQN